MIPGPFSAPHLSVQKPPILNLGCERKGHFPKRRIREQNGEGTLMKINQQSPAKSPATLIQVGFRMPLKLFNQQEVEGAFLPAAASGQRASVSRSAWNAFIGHRSCLMAEGCSPTESPACLIQSTWHLEADTHQCRMLPNSRVKQTYRTQGYAYGA